MKKIMVVVLAAIMLVMPFTSIKAETTVNGSVKNYKVGDEINFYRNKTEKENNVDNNAGQATILLSEEKFSYSVDGANYLKVLALSPFGGTDVYYDPNVESMPMEIVRQANISHIEAMSEYPWEAVMDLKSTLTYITLDELITVFGATYNATDDTYSIDVAKWGTRLEDATQGSYNQNGFYTSTYDLTNNTVWVVEFKYDSDDITTRKLTDMTVKKVSMDTNTYGYLPVVYFDETYDCHYVESQESYACYACGEDYTWTEVGKQAETCTLVETVKTKSACAKNVKTGIEEYALEFAGIIAVCAVALVIIKRKELFRGI